MSSAADNSNQPQYIETFQSLLFAFVLAMVFRGFVVEGFVIPTGSMAPTLRGMHLQKESPQTGQSFAVGFDNARAFSPDRFSDPLLGRRQSLGSMESKRLAPQNLWTRSRAYCRASVLAPGVSTGSVFWNSNRRNRPLTDYGRFWQS